MTLLGTSLRQTVHTHRASVYQAAKLVAALLRVARVTAGLAESNGSLPPGLWLTSLVVWLPRTGISFGTLRSAVEYGLPLPFLEFASAVWVYWWTGYRVSNATFNAIVMRYSDKDGHVKFNDFVAAYVKLKTLFGKNTHKSFYLVSCQSWISFSYICIGIKITINCFCLCICTSYDIRCV